MHFQLVNERDNLIIEPNIKVLLKLYNMKTQSRSFYNLDLRISKIIFFPANWRIVHEINDKSPLKSFSKKDLEEMDMEIVVLFQGFDESFHQPIYVRHSYGDEQVLWDKHFLPTFHTDEKGNTLVDIEEIDAYEED